MKDAIRYRIPAMNPVMKMTFAANVIRAVAVAALLATTATAQEKEALTLQLPAPTLKGTPEQLPTGPNIEANSDKAPAAMQIAKGAKNVALGKTVTTSVKPFSETQPDAITDGKKEAFDYDTVEMKKGTQWVQVDLGESLQD
jgi:hypothetical protein